MQQLSAHFTLDEMIVSQTAARLAISNVPPPDILERLAATAQQMERVRDLLGCPVIVSSGYRSPALNAATPGSSKTSAHCLGYAVDFICPAYGSPLAVATYLYGKLRDEAGAALFDQVIHEYGAWCHVSFDPRLRGEALTAKHVNGKPVYIPGLSAV